MHDDYISRRHVGYKIRCACGKFSYVEKDSVLPDCSYCFSSLNWDKSSIQNVMGGQLRQVREEIAAQTKVKQPGVPVSQAHRSKTQRIYD